MAEQLSMVDHLTFLKGTIDSSVDDDFSLSPYELVQLNDGTWLARSLNAHYWDASGSLVRPLSSRLERDESCGLYIVEAHPLQVSEVEVSDSRLVFSGVLDVIELTAGPEPLGLSPEQFGIEVVSAMASHIGAIPR